MAEQTAPSDVAGPLPASAAPRGLIGRRLGLLSPDWLPRVLIAGDAAITGASVLAAYGYRVHLDFINPRARDLLFGPYVPAVPIAVAIYLVGLAINGQYR